MYDIVMIKLTYCECNFESSKDDIRKLFEKDNTPIFHGCKFYLYNK